MVGGAAGALIGLMFVVATLTGNLGREQSLRGSAIYMAPTVAIFSVVLGVSALTAVPKVSGAFIAVLLGGLSAVGMSYGVSILLQMFSRAKPAPPDWTDYWCYGAAPIAAYAALGGVALAFAAGRPWAAYALAGVLFAALLLGIRNAWDLVTWLAPVAKGSEPN
jgi:hypothetical protein